jgi:hypothetical protein
MRRREVTTVKVHGKCYRVFFRERPAWWPCWLFISWHTIRGDYSTEREALDCQEAVVANGASQLEGVNNWGYSTHYWHPNVAREQRDVEEGED